MNNDLEALTGFGKFVPSVEEFSGTLLHLAASADRADDAKRLLYCGANANARDKYGCTPLHAAVQEGNVTVFRVLLHHPGINLNAAARDGRTPLMFAADLGLEDMVDDLVAAGADVNAADVCGATALHYAVMFEHKRKRTCVIDEILDYGSINVTAKDEDIRDLRPKRKNIVKKLLHAGADANAQNKDGCTPLNLSVLEGVVDIFRILLHHRTTDLNVRMNDGENSLTFATFWGMESFVIDLVDAGADVNVVDGSGTTPLHAAVKFNQANIVRKLLDGNANVHVQDSTGETPLHTAVEADNLTVFRMLLNHPGINPNALTDKGQTPLMIAAYLEREAMVSDLIAAGADLNAADCAGMTALHWSAVCASFDGCCGIPYPTTGPHATQMLLDAGADPNARDAYGNTPLHSAARSKVLGPLGILLRHRGTDLNARCNRGKVPMMSLLEHPIRPESRTAAFEALINAGADVNATDGSGKSVLHYATEADDLHALNLLLERGADVNATDEAGMTPLHAALESESADVFPRLTSLPATDLNARRWSDGKTPLMMILESEFFELNEFMCLINAGVDFRAADSEGKTALHYCAKFNRVIEMSYILSALHHADVDVRDFSGQTPLFVAASEGRVEICSHLIIRHFAERGIGDHMGRLPIDVARENRHENIVTLLTNNYMPGG